MKFDLRSWVTGYTFGLVGKPLPFIGISYTPVEYIQFTGSQYIDTGILCNQNTIIEAEFMRDTENAQYFYGATSTDNKASVTAYLSTGAGNWRFGGTYASLTVSKGVKHTSVANVNGVKFDATNKKYNGTVGTFVTPATLALGTNHAESGTFSTSYFSGKVYSFKIYDGDALVLDYAPVITMEGEYGFYDSVSGRFCSSNSGVPLVGGGTITKQALNTVSENNDAMQDEEMQEV